MVNHNELVASASAAINAIFGDMSVDQATTLDSLKLLAEELDVMIETLETDIERADQM